MPGLYTQYKIYLPGEILTALDLNATDRQHIIFNVPSAIESFSTTLDQSRIQVPSATLALSLDGEIARIREKLRLLGGVTFWDQISGPFPVSGTVIPIVRGLIGSCTGGTSTFAAQAQSVLFSDGIKRTGLAPPLTWNLALAGPAAGGRDQAANFSNDWVHLYYIWNGTTATASTIASLSPPQTGPVLPSGYTGWAYALSLRIGAPNIILYAGVKIAVNGGYVTYHPAQPVLTGGVATAETAVTIGVFVPTALFTRWSAIVWPRPVAAVNTIASSVIDIRLFPGINYRSFGTEFGGVSGAARVPAYETTVPVQATAFVFYKVNNFHGTTAVDIAVSGYYVPNGDS